MELVYDLEGNFLYRNTEIPSEDLPITVLAVVNQGYPGYVIGDWVNQQDWSEGMRYEIKLGGRSRGLEVLVAEDGTLLYECDQ